MYLEPPINFKKWSGNKWEGGGRKASLIKCVQDKNKTKKKIYAPPWEKKINKFKKNGTRI